MATMFSFTKLGASMSNVIKHFVIFGDQPSVFESGKCRRHPYLTL
jgi:hypothetical protein